MITLPSIALAAVLASEPALGVQVPKIVSTARSAKVDISARNIIVFTAPNGHVTVVNIKRPRPIKEVLGFLHDYRVQLMEALIAANPDGDQDNSLAIAENITGLLSISDVLTNQPDAMLLLGKAYELRLKALIVTYRAHTPDPAQRRKKLIPIENSIRNALYFSARAGDDVANITANQCYGGFEDELGNHAVADVAFQNAAFQVKRFDQIEARRYIRLIRFGQISEAKLRPVADAYRQGILAVSNFAEAQHLRSVVFRELNAQEKDEVIKKHWGQMMGFIGQSIEATRSLKEYKQLSHALQWRAGMTLLDGDASRDELERVVADSIEAAESLELSRGVSTVYTHGERPFHVGWDESAACSTSEMQGLIRLNELSSPEKDPQRLERARKTAALGKNALKGSPTDASLTTLSMLLNGLGVALLTETEDTTLTDAAKSDLTKKAALAFALADACDASVAGYLPYMPNKRRSLPKSDQDAASEYVAKNLRADSRILRSFISLQSEL
jgi:hypothetical protein